jgi:hypothetical protein
MEMKNNDKQMDRKKSNYNYSIIFHLLVFISVLIFFICLIKLKGEIYNLQPQLINYDWLQFNFDPQHSGNNTKETKINYQNAGNLHQLFKISLPAIADGAPVYLSDVKAKTGLVNILFVTTKE